MKNTMLTLIALVAAVPAAAVPDVVTYAARVENDAGPFDGTVSAVFQLFDAPTGGTELWSETAASVVVVDGDLVHDLGSVEPLDDAVLANDQLFLAVTFNGDALSPRAAIRAVPFALKARDAETLDGLSADDVATDEEVADAVADLSFATLPGVPASFRDGAISFVELTAVPTALADGQITLAEIGGLSAGLADNVDDDTVATAAVGGGLVVDANNGFAIGPQGVTGAQIKDGAITNSKLAAACVDGFAILNGSVGSSDLGDDSVTNAKIGNSAVDTNEIASAAVTETKIENEAITAIKIRGAEVNVRAFSDGCQDAGEITFSGSCGSTVCQTSPSVKFFDCSGGCTRTSQITCNNPLIGKLLAPNN